MNVGSVNNQTSFGAVTELGERALESVILRTPGVSAAEEAEYFARLDSFVKEQEWNKWVDLDVDDEGIVCIVNKKFGNEKINVFFGDDDDLFIGLTKKISAETRKLFCSGQVRPLALLNEAVKGKNIKQYNEIMNKFTDMMSPEE